jgi:hypothetical protein
VEDSTKTVEVLVWRAIAINWRQGSKTPLVERSTVKWAFQQAQACCHRRKHEEDMEDLPRPCIVGGDLAALTFRGDSE